MVKAGVYLLARTHPLLGDTWLWTHLVTAIGLATMLLGAIATLGQKDLKRILAYSTLAVLGTLAASWLPEGAVQSLVVDGLIGGVGGVLVFLPQILILFLFIAVLEDCGYLARAAFMVDRLMRPLGLSGRAFIPLLSSFACAVPAILGTRSIADRRERLITILIAPFMSCSARLPVYVLLIGALGLSAALLFFTRHWFPPVPALAAITLGYPLWSWRRLEGAMRFLDQELSDLQRQRAELAIHQEADAQTAMSFLARILPVRGWSLQDAKGRVVQEQGDVRPVNRKPAAVAPTSGSSCAKIINGSVQSICSASHASS